MATILNNAVGTGLLLQPNEIFASLYNMIISEQVFSNNIAGTKSSLVDRARVDGGLYGDTKMYVATDVLASFPWEGDAEAANLLELNRPADPEVQLITLDVFRQIRLTVDNYLTKRAWGTENAFSQFNSVLLSWIGGTKKVYDATLYNSYIGTAVSPEAGQNITVALPAEPTSGSEADDEAYARIEAQTIAKTIADLLVNLEDVSREYNDYGNLRSFDSDDLIFVWNSEWVNRINKLDLPTIFNKEGLMDKFAEYTLPARYFGVVEGEVEGDGATKRSAVETTVGGKHIFPGDIIPEGETVQGYTEDANIICKVMHKDSVPYMSAFEVGTSFFNPRSLTENHYLTFGHNTLQYLKNYPFITIKAQKAE